MHLRKLAWFGSLAALVVLAFSLAASGTNQVFASVPLASGFVSPAGVNLDRALSAGSRATGNIARGFDCSKVHQLGIDRQMNLHASAIMVACGFRPGGSPVKGVTPRAAIGSPFAPAYGGTDVDVILPDGIYPLVTQSESFTWANGNTIVVNYNDSRQGPNCSGGISYSTDGGATWTSAWPLCSGHGSNWGDPIVVYNARLATWFAGDLAGTGTGGCTSNVNGAGIGLWTSPDGLNWTAGVCVHGSTTFSADDDRESMWVDNNPASPYYGRMYISWNDFNTANANLVLSYSDNGSTWSAPVTLDNNTFVRDGQVTGSPNGDGTVFVSGHTEGTTDINYMYRSTNGGASWTRLTVNTYTPAGDTTTCPGEQAVPPIWRAPEWGQPAVSGLIGGQNVVHYAYAAHGTGGDLGDIYYVRSTNNGATWSAPVKMNTDSTTQPQWQPSLSAAPSGVVNVTWYDRRNTTDGTNYQYFARTSSDNGTTWQADQPVSDVLIPQPAQPDPNTQACYAGDYNYQSMLNNTALVAWTDGRNQISGVNQQDVEFDQVAIATASPTPTGSATITPTGTPSSTPTSTRTGTPTNTRTNTPTNTPTSTRTSTPASTITGTPTSTPTSTPSPTPSNTQTNTPTSTPTSTYTATNTPTAAGVIVGHVTWQGISQPNSRNSGITATLTLCVNGAPQAYAVATDASGFFTATTGLADGAYNWSLKGALSLSNAGSLTITQGAANPEMGTMRAGDSNGSNTVTSIDFNILKGTFGKSQGQTGYDARGDFNRDAVVNSVDFNLMKGNFGQAGNALTCP